VNPYETDRSRTGEFEYSGHRASVECVAAVEVDGRTVVASGDRGNALHFWYLDTGERFG
jgi:hypothetical protein